MRSLLDRPRRRLHLAAGLLALAAAAGVGAARWGTPRGVLEEVARAAPPRPFAPRISLALDHRDCPAEAPPEGGSVPSGSCGTGTGAPPRVAALARHGGTSDPDTLRASALAGLVWWDGEEASLDAAVARLSRALRLSAVRAPVLVDLSGAHLVRAERTQNPRDLVQALEYALEALETDPGNAAARFNAALALESMAIVERAEAAWDAYLAIDRRSRWADEARRRRAALAPAASLPPPTPASSPATIAAYARRHPQEARLLGMDDVLGRWGAQVEAGNAREAASLLRFAESLGAALEAQGGDASLIDAVRAIRAADGDAAATLRLAAGHRAFAAGIVSLAGKEFAAAEKAFFAAAELGAGSPVLTRSAEMFAANAIVYQRRFDEAEPALRRILSRLDTLRHPAVAGRARWMLAASLVRSGKPDPARPLANTARRLLDRAGELEYAGMSGSIVAEVAFAQRDTLAAYRALHASLMRMRHRRASIWLHNVLMDLVHFARGDGMFRAAAEVQEEDFAVALRTDDPVYEIEAHLGRARLPGADAGRELARATELLEGVTSPVALDWFATRLQAARAVATSGAAGLAPLDSAIAALSDPDDPLLLLPLLLHRAELRLARGELETAAADLEAATARLRGLSDGHSDVALRAAVVEKARVSFDRLVMVHLRRGDPAAALAALERGRASFSPVPGAPAAGPPRAPDGDVAVEYALVGDTLLTWTLRGESMELARRVVRREALLRTIERVATALESPATAAAAEPDLARLHALLVRPVRHRLGGPGTPLVILADGEVAAIPFAALLDAERGRRLVEDHPLRFAATLADAARGLPPRRARPREALLVADPAFDRARHPTLDRLPGARAEVDSLRALYSPHRVLAGAAATPEALAAGAERAGVIHYAGHAVFDDTRPERSYLVLAGSGMSGRMDAGAVNALRLDGVRVVVLSACRTLRARDGRTGGLAGFAGALLAAGAGGVVGSAWEVDDALVQPLMAEFHRALRESGDPAAALRTAQLRLLRSGDPALRSPAAWAGFRYVGGSEG